MSEIIQLSAMSYGSEAIGRMSSGKAVFVEGGVPGDVVACSITCEKPSFARACIERIVQPSTYRVATTSQYDKLCGSASWQHIAYEQQCALKRSNIIAQLERIGKLSPDKAKSVVRETLPSKRIWEYRNKIELAVRFDRTHGISVGYTNPQTGEVVANPMSLLVEPPLQKAARALQGVLRFALGKSDYGMHRISMRYSRRTRSFEVALWCKPGSFPRNFVAKALNDSLHCSSVVRVLSNPQTPRVIKGIEVLAGKGYWHEQLICAGETFDFYTQAPAFFQVNTHQAGCLVQQVLDALGDIDGARVADLYAGGGTFSIPLAAAGAQVFAVESVGASVRDLRRNALENCVDVDVCGGDAARELAALGADGSAYVGARSGADCCEDCSTGSGTNSADSGVKTAGVLRTVGAARTAYVAGTARTAHVAGAARIAHVAGAARAHAALDALVVDPPRAGLAASVPADIVKSGAQRMVYVSCDPATLARDIARLQDCGMQLERVQPVDMFPQTFRVECVCLMSKA